MQLHSVTESARLHDNVLLIDAKYEIMHNNEGWFLSSDEVSMSYEFKTTSLVRTQIL